MREYEDKIARVKIPYEPLRQLYLEYDGFTSGQQNEEAWVPYLNYPLMKSMSYMEKKNIYDTYASVRKKKYIYAKSMILFFIFHII